MEGELMKHKIRYLFEGFILFCFPDTVLRLASDFGFPDSASQALGSQACPAVQINRLKASIQQHSAQP